MGEEGLKVWLSGECLQHTQGAGHDPQHQEGEGEQNKNTSK
jgi:hypothetical protein